MASSQPVRGRGRGRETVATTSVPSPSITSPTESLDSSISVTPAVDVSVLTNNTSVTDINTTDTGFSSASSNVPSPQPALATTSGGRGRAGGSRVKLNIAPPDPKLSTPSPDPKRDTASPAPSVNTAPPDPYWMVTNLTQQHFISNNRPTKPHQLGTLGDQIQVLVNYFPILNFPHKGLVYKYHIQIRNKKDLEISRDRRRLLYNSWLQALCRRYPQIDKHKIVFDNQAAVLTFDQQLPDTYNDNSTGEPIIGPNRSNRQEQHTVIVQRVGKPVDLSLIQNLDELFDRDQLSNDRLEDLQDVKQVLSIALHEHCSSHAQFIYHRSFFAPTIQGEHGEWDLGLGKAMWRGFYSCLVFGRGRHKLLMNLDVKHTVFMKKQPFLEFVCEIMLHSPCGKRKYGRDRKVTKVDGTDVLRFLDISNPTYRSEVDFVQKQCKRLRVRSQDADKPITYEIQKLGMSASRQEFQLKSKESHMVTVENYYRERYNLELKYPSLPTLEMRNGSFLPMELVDVEPVRVKKITDDQRALLCKYSTTPPQTYRQTVDRIRRNPDQRCFEQDPFVAAWNFNVGMDMLTVPARVLPMPEIVYTEQYRVTATSVRDRGAWELKPTQLYKPTKFPAVWGMINVSSLPRRACEDFYSELSMVAEQRGIACSPPAIYEEREADRHAIEEIVDILKNLMKENDDCKFFLVILPLKNTPKNKEAYRTLKKLCELESGLGLVTQMIEQKNAIIGSKRDPKRWDHAKLSNILLKINSKLDGTNSVLKVHNIVERFFSRGHRIMYVGADLSHPAPGALTQPSIVAVVASADDVPNRYFKEVYQQHRPPQARGESREYIVNMKEIMKSLISQYAQHRGGPPTAIVFYRDGISEGEFDSVFEKELTGIQQACVELSPVYRPYLTYIVVSKRHHTRLFATNSEKNVVAGTIVDSHDITSATHYDFYLNSHHGALGTSRPTHYYVLYDDNKLTPNEVQMLTYALCYTYARCTRSVSIPAPVKYADLLALRGTLYVQMDDQSDTESVASGPRIPVNEEVDVNNTIRGERIVLSSKIAPDCPFFL